MHAVSSPKHYVQLRQLVADVCTLHLITSMGPAKRRMGAHWTAWTRIEARTAAHGRALRRKDTQ